MALLPITLAALKLVAGHGAAPGVPRGFNQQPSNVRVAGLGDAAAPAPLAGGVLGRNESNEGHELLCTLKAGEIAYLSDDANRGGRVDTAQATRPPDELAATVLLGGLVNPRVKLRDAAINQVECVLVPVKHKLLSREWILPPGQAIRVA